MNRLRNSTSPYLLQHADNPVDWWPWCDEAFAEAARFKPAVDKFFDDVLVMAPDPVVRQGRLRLLRRLEDVILKLADISEIVSEGDK